MIYGSTALIDHFVTNTPIAVSSLKACIELSMLYSLKEKIVQPASLTARARADSMTFGDTVARARRLRRPLMVYDDDDSAKTNEMCNRTLAVPL